MPNIDPPSRTVGRRARAEAQANPAELTTCDICGVARRLPAACDCCDETGKRPYAEDTAFRG